MKFIRVLKASEDVTAKDHLRWLIYQVCNGGVLQYCNNGYADDLLEYTESHNIIQELQDMGCPQEGIDAISKMIKLLKDYSPFEECIDCNGSGEWENEDENGDIETSTCETCRGNGYIETNKWADSDEQSWMERYDKWLYALNLDQLDDWTEQSHTHSVALDMINQNKENK